MSQASERIGIDPLIMGGKPCLRNTRVSVGTIVGLMAEGHSHDEILKAERTVAR